MYRHQLAKKMVPVTAEMTTAVVLEAQENASFMVEEAGIPLAAQRAESCLIAPETGDEVLLARTADGRAFVTAVLERPGGGERRLDLPGDVALSAREGKVEISARDGVALRTPGEVTVTSAGLNLTAAVGRVMVQNVNMAGKVARATWDHVRLRAASADQSVDHLLSRFKLRSTRVEGLDRQRVGTLQQEVDGVHTAQSEYSVTRARKDVRMDGRQIIMG